jgi:hypothetical protein
MRNANRSVVERRGERGVAMVEAAAVLPLFVVLWFVTLYAHSYFAKKLDVNAKARANAWGFAMSNCGNQGQSPTDPTPNNVSASSVQGTSSNISGSDLTGGNGAVGFVGVILQILMPFVSMPINGSQSTEKADVSYGWPAPYHRGAVSGSKTVQGNVKVFCNEAPENGTLDGFVLELWNYVKPPGL